MARVTVGPIIGKVDSDSARVLLEINESIPVTVVAKHRDHVVRVRKRFKKDRPGVVTIDELRPGTDYRLDIVGADERRGVRGRIRTLPEPLDRLRVAVVSCNKVDPSHREDLWQHLDHHADDFDYVFHLGDQVYGDNTFSFGRSLLGSRKTMPKTTKAEIEERFRDLYRLTWTWDHTARFLARTPSLMIWDDHEIRDDWGSRLSDLPTTGDDGQGSLQTMLVAECARNVYREYQQQLHEDIDQDLDDDCGHIHDFGPVAAVFVDQRGGRSFAQTAEELAAEAKRKPKDRSPYLSANQWDKLRAALEPGGSLDDARCLVLATSVPLVYLTTKLQDLAEGAADDLADHWNSDEHRNEQLRMLDLLRDWKRAGAGEREVIVVGGDVHVGGHTTITATGRGRGRGQGQPTTIEQLITSPVTNKPPRWFEFPFLRALLELQVDIGGSYRVDHRRFTNRRNYGILDIDPTGPTITPSLQPDER